MYRSLRGLGAEAGFSVSFGTGSGGGSSGSYKTMDICANKGGTKFISYNNVGGWNATCNNGQSCKRTSSITDPVCTAGSSGSPPPPPPPPTKDLFWGTFAPTGINMGTMAAKPGSSAIKIGATGSNRPAPLAPSPLVFSPQSSFLPKMDYTPVKIGATGSNRPAPLAPSPLVFSPQSSYLPKMDYTPVKPGQSLVDVAPGAPGGGEYKTKTYMVIGLGLLVLGGVGYAAYKKSK